MRDVSALIARDSSNAALYQRRARLYLTLGQGTRAVADANRVMMLDGPKAASYVLRAQALRQAGRLKEAAADCEEAGELGYDEPDLPLLRGELAYIERRYQPAMDYLNEALKRSPFEEKAYFYKGLIYAESGDTARAISNLQTATEQAPNMADGFSHLAAIYNAKKDYATARQYLNAGLRLSPDDGFLYYNIGVNLVLQHLPDSAIQAFARAARLDTTLYLAHLNAGVLQYERNRFAPAARHLRTMLRLSPVPPPNTRLMLADCLDRLGQYRAAAREYAAAAKEEPGDARISQRLAAARSRFRQQQADSAAGRPSRVASLDSLRKIR